jgi:F-type H+-transporting ATPase subunit a
MPVVELIGVFTKPFSLTVRLFANITAGHIIILSLFSIIFIFESVWIGPVSVIYMSLGNVFRRCRCGAPRTGRT